MCSELFRIPYEWGGVPIFGFGVLLAIWAVASAIGMVRLIRANGWNAETWSYVPGILILGAVIFFVPWFFPAGLPVRGYGMMVLAGSVAGIGLACYRAMQVGIHYDLILSLAFAMFLAGIVGARAFYVIEYWESTFRKETWWDTIVATFSYTEGGLVVFGALLGAAVAFVWFVRRQKLPVLAMADLIAPSLVVGLALGRVGCFLNGCCYGGPSDLPWAVSFPKYSASFTADDGSTEGARLSPAYVDQAVRGEMHGFRLSAEDNSVYVARVSPASPADMAGLHAGDKIAEINGQPIASIAEAEEILFDALRSQAELRLRLQPGAMLNIPPVPIPERSLPVHPTQLYSAVNAALLAWFLWAYYPFRGRDGEVLALMLTIYPISRFLLEMIRVDESPVFGTGLSISQNISLAVLAAVVGLWIYLRRQPQHLALAPANSASQETVNRP